MLIAPVPDTAPAALAPAGPIAPPPYVLRYTVVPVDTGAGFDDLRQACAQAPEAIDAALDDFDFRQATSAVWRIVDEAKAIVARALV